MPSGQIKSRDGEIKLISVVFVLSNLKHLIYFTCFYLISFICRWKQNSLWNQQRNPDMPFVSLRRSTMQHSFVPELEEWVKSGEHLWEVLVTLSCIIPMFQFQYVVMVNNPPKTIHCDGFWEQKDNTLFSAADDSGRTDNTYNGYNKLLNYYFILLYHSVSKNVFILIVIRKGIKITGCLNNFKRNILGCLQFYFSEEKSMVFI